MLQVILRRLRPWHRRLALVAALPVLAWTLTGILHPLMSRWQPSAAARQPLPELLSAPAGQQWSDYPAPAAVLPSGLVLRELRALTWQGHPYWLLQDAEGALHYRRADTGAVEAPGPAIAEALARHYTGERTVPARLTWVTAFSAEYPKINRYLPVWRVAFARDDGLVAFIEPRSLQLAALGDTWKTRFSQLFGQLHSWSWWHHEGSRDLAQVTLLAGVALLVLSGLSRALTAPAGRPPLARWHRRVGLLVSLAALAWVSSAIFHVLAIDKHVAAFATYPADWRFRSDDLRRPAPAVAAGERLQVVAAPSGPLWRLARSGGGGEEHRHHGGGMATAGAFDRYLSVRDGRPVPVDDYLRALAAPAAAGAGLRDSAPVTRFGGEYGFINKRLPVYRLRHDGPGHPAVYIDPADGAVAAVIRDLDRAEGYSFSTLHKAHWLDDLGKDARDAILAAFALLIFVLTLVGLRQLRRPRHGRAQ